MRTFRLVSIWVACAFFGASCLPPNNLSISGLESFHWQGLKNLRSVYAGSLSVSINTNLSSQTGKNVQSAARHPATFRVLFDSNGIRSPHPSNQQHGTGTSFTPDDPASLSGLEAYDGDITTRGGKMSCLSVNSGNTLSFSTGTLVLLPVPPAAEQLAYLYSRPDVVQVDQLGSFFRVKFNLSSVPIQSLAQKIRAVNQFNVEPIQDVTFSSLDAVRTFQLATSFVVDQQDRFQSASLDFGTNTTFHAPGPNNHPGHFDAYKDKSNLPPFWGNPVLAHWWLTDLGANVEEAWVYGFGGGVRAAIIDKGMQLAGQKEFDRRIEWDKAEIFWDGYRANRSIDQISPETDKEWHGNWVTSAAYSERDNDLGVSGVAPNVTFAPKNMLTTWNWADAISASINDDVDLISFSLGVSLNDYQWWQFALGFVALPFVGLLFEGIEYWVSKGPVVEQIARAKTAGIPVFVPAGNEYQKRPGLPDNGKCEDFFPCNLGQFDRFSHMISVGAIEMRLDPTTDLPLPLPDRYSKASYSGYGDIVSIWGPSGGNDGSTHPAGVYTSVPNNLVQPELMAGGAGGTSFATPVVAGVGALMIGSAKRHGRRLTPEELKEILRTTARPIDWTVAFYSYWCSPGSLHDLSTPVRGRPPCGGGHSSIGAWGRDQQQRCVGEALLRDCLEESGDRNEWL